jgi:hypothetical protein
MNKLMNDRRALFPLGCALRDGVARVAQVQATQSGVRRLLAMVWRERDLAVGGPALAHTIGGTAGLARSGFSGSEAVACVFSDEVSFRRFCVTAKDGDDFQNVLRVDAARMFGLDEEAIRTDHYKISGDDVIGIIVPTDTVHARISAAERFGVRIRAVDTSISAIARCVPSGVRDLMLIELTPGAWTIAMVRDGAPWFACSRLRPDLRNHAADAGTDGSSTPTAGASPAERGPGAGESDLARQALMTMQASLHYLIEGGLAADIPRAGCIVGAGDAEQTIIAALNQAHATEFVPCGQLFEPLVRRLTPEIPPDEIADWLVPTGLALYGTSGVGALESA